MLCFEMPEYSSWEFMKNSGRPVVIYGMGNGADIVLDELYRLGIPVMGVTASDDFVRGQIFRGFTVRKISEFEGDFIVAVAFGTCIPEVIERIYSLRKEHTVIVPVVPVYGGEIFNRDFVDKYRDKINEAYGLFTGRSKEIFALCVRFMFGGNLDDLAAATTEKDEIFSGFLGFKDNESYLDLGAYKGDTIDEFLRYSGGKYSRITALEPDKKNCAKMLEKYGDRDNITIINKAVSSCNKPVLFSSRGGRNSSVSSSGTPVDCTTVDELCSDFPVSYIKADIEGEEINMLKGAENTIRKYLPKLNIALYHKSADIFEIPLLINKMIDGYEFEIRKHPYIPCWDMNLYAKKR